MAHPGKKLTFMGTELAQFMEWRFRYGLDWDLLNYESHEKHNTFVKELNHLYIREKSLWEQDHSWEGFRWIEADNNVQSIIEFYRQSKDWKDFILVICNFTPETYEDYRIGVPRKGEYIEVLNSDSESFGGSGVINNTSRKSENIRWQNQPYSIQLRIPPLAMVYLKAINIKPRLGEIRFAPRFKKAIDYENFADGDVFPNIKNFNSKKYSSLR